MATALEVCQPVLWRFSTDDYLKMLKAGILSESDRVELIDGEVRCMSPIGTRHQGIVNYLNHHLTRLVGEAAIVSIQGPLQLNDFTEPEPDITVLQWRSDFYRTAKPSPSDVLLLIEVADSSPQYDRTEKLPRYAAAGIPEVWIIDVNEGRKVVEQYANPQAGEYSLTQCYMVGKTIVSVSLPALIRFTLADLFG